MRVYLTVLGLCCAAITAIALCVDVTFVREFEENAMISAGITTGEARFPEILFASDRRTPDVDQRGNREISPEQPAEEPRNEPETKDAEEEVTADTPSEDETPSTTEKRSVFAQGGCYRIDFSEGFDADVAARVDEKVASAMGYSSFEYGIFGSSGGMEPLGEPLDEREVAYVFSEMIRAYMRSLSFSGDLREISFELQDAVLKVEMWVSVSLEEISNKYPLLKLPASALFRSCSSFSIENSEISVQNEDLSFTCESYPISQSLLIFGFKTLLGEKDPRATFALLIKNVLVNAGIYR